MEQLPDKDFFSIGEVAKLLEVEAYTIRYWQKEFNLKIPTKPNGRRIFTPEVIEVLLRIKRLRYEDKIQIDGVKHQLRQDEGKSAVVGRQTVPELVYPADPAAIPDHGPAPQPLPAAETPPEEMRTTLLNEKRQSREQRYLIDELKRIKSLLDDPEQKQQ